MPNPNSFRLQLPFDQPTKDSEHAANWRMVKDWDSRLLPTGRTLLATNTLATAVASVDFNTIPQNFNHLYIVANSSTSAASGRYNLGLQFNGDTGANYVWARVGTTSFAAPATNNVAGDTSAVIGQTTGNTGFSVCTATLFNYAVNNYSKPGVSQNATWELASSLIASGGLQWTNTNAINRITIVQASGGNFQVGSRFYIYGEY